MLRQLSDFLPRVKPSAASRPPTSNGTAPLSSIKRDLVRLLGVLTFEDTAVGDLVQGCGGVQLVLSMTEVDVSNPCMSHLDRKVVFGADQRAQIYGNMRFS